MFLKHRQRAEERRIVRNVCNTIPFDFSLSERGSARIQTRLCSYFVLAAGLFENREQAQIGKFVGSFDLFRG